MGVTIVKINETKDGVQLKLRVNGEIRYEEMKFSNYFYILACDFEEISYLIYRQSKNLEPVVDKFGVEYIRIYLKNNFHRNMLRNEIEESGIKTFEADITAPKRLLIDNPNFKLNQNGLKIAFYDIETDDREGFVYDKSGEILPDSAITSIAIQEFKDNGETEIKYIRNKGVDGSEFDEYRKLRTELCRLKKEDLPTLELVNSMKDIEKKVSDALWKGEIELLKEYFEYIKDFDVVSAYNGNGFDDAWVRFRTDAHVKAKDFQKYYDDYNLVGFDYMICYKANHWTPVKSYKLDRIAYEELKSELEKENSVLKDIKEITKVDWKSFTDADKYFDLFLLYPDVHRDYNEQDVKLLNMLEKKLKFFKLHFMKSEKSHLLLVDTLYGSKSCDMMILKSARVKNIIKNSKPTQAEVDALVDNPPGGFTFCYIPGLHWSVKCYDFASHYLNVMRTFNISRETYKRNVPPDLTKVFNENEIKYIHYCHDNAGKFTTKKKYFDDIEIKRKELEVDDMERLMWKFIENYDNKIDLEENECCTPADINLDTIGWRVHNHFIFDTKERGIVPEILDDLIIERNSIKYNLKNLDKDSFEYEVQNTKQLALKLSGNEFYGNSLFKSSREYMYEIGTAITTSARYLTKICMIETRDNGMLITNGDTDSVYCVGDKSKEFLDNKFKELLNEKLKVFKTMKNREGKIHTIDFEYEDTYDAMIVVKKKRYYYLINGEIGGKGGYSKRSDVLLITKTLQKELMNDLFNKTFDVSFWKDKLLKFKDKVYNYELEEKDITKVSAISKQISEYGKPMIDKKTGIQKITKDGKLRFSNIPANVKIAKQMIEEGYNVVKGDKISYIVLESKPKIKPITIKEFKKLKKYDCDYYHKTAIKGVLEILMVINKELIVNELKDCFGYTERQLDNLKKKMDEEDE